MVAQKSPIQSGTPWWGMLLWVALGLVAVAAIFYCYFTPMPFGIIDPKNMRITLGIILGVAGVIGLVILFKKDVLAPAWQPRPLGKIIGDMARQAEMFNQDFPIDLYGDKILGSWDASVVTSGGSQTLIRGPDFGVYNGRQREFLWDDRWKVFRSNISNAFEQLDGAKTAKRISGMEMVLTGRLPVQETRPEIIEKITNNGGEGERKDSGMLGAGSETDDLNREAGQ